MLKDMGGVVSRLGGSDPGVLEDPCTPHQGDGRADGGEEDGHERMEASCAESAPTLQKGLQTVLGDDGL